MFYPKAKLEIPFVISLATASPPYEYTLLAAIFGFSLLTNFSSFSYFNPSIEQFSLFLDI